MSDQRVLAIVIVGHVDHGKSTLIGRLLHDTGSLADGKFEEILASSTRRGVPIEWSFVLDSLQAERDQAITIDTSRVWFRHDGRRYAIIDAPGHRQFIANMLSGASEADAAVLMVDVTEGVSEQTRRHAYLLSLLGIEQVVVAINKLDAVGYDRDAFDRVAHDIRAHLADLHVTPAAVVPISAREGDSLIVRSANLPWYTGPTLLEVLAGFAPALPRADGPLRLRVQDVYRFGTRRVIAGRVESGRIAQGDVVAVSPAGTSARVASIERWPDPGRQVAAAGESIGFTLDTPVYVDRGDLISHLAHAPARGHVCDVALFWLADRPPVLGERLRLHFGPTEARVTLEEITRVIDTRSLDTTEVAAQYTVLEARLRSPALLALDTRETGSPRCVVLRGSDVVAGGTILAVVDETRATNVQPHRHLVARDERAQRNGHRGAVIWLTGLSGSGKSTLAMALERRLFERGMNVYVLDGDNIRSGINRDLGFSVTERTENIRRVGEVAALFADAGVIAIAAFISPLARDRQTAREAAGAAFHEIAVSADLATCEGRDVKGLYARARRGEIADFTGISAPYEAPESPELLLDTAHESLETCLERLLEYALDATSLVSRQADLQAGSFQI
ncbi:MAG: adenylyl-sulfate kinase [Candidatus Velthaea sp.]